MSDLIEQMEINTLIENTKGGLYYQSTYNANLDLYAGLSRHAKEEDIISTFEKAYKEDRMMALANLLFILDIREGKGERRLFKVIFHYLCNINPNDAVIILKYIGELGRYDYILEGLNTRIEDEVVKLIKTTLKEDKKSDNPSLLAKWLPSHRSHNKNSPVAKHLVKLMNITEKEYRKTLSSLRSKIKVVEKNLTNKNYDEILFENVPSKAMLKYTNVFNKEIKERFEKYKQALIKGETKINTKGLFCYEVVKQTYNQTCDVNILNAMWDNQKQINIGDKNILVVADTSGSMFCFGGLPYFASIGLALYTAQHNKGVFKDSFITFSSSPKIQRIKGDNIVDKVRGIESIVGTTDIDKVFDLILKSMKKSNSKQEDLPSHIVIVSDMEFDAGVNSREGTNFEGWKKTFEKAGYKLPKIIFWNVAAQSYGVPATKYDNDCVMVSGFSTNLLEKLFDIESYNPVDQMKEALKKYIEMIN